MKIKTVAIIGAGAIGSYFIAGLTEKLGDDLWIVAEGERKERLEKNGIVINDQKYDLHVKTPPIIADGMVLIMADTFGIKLMIIAKQAAILITSGSYT